ncbi:MAG TPA: hypothetical protein VK908_16710, partial [Jiangellales bacterium]|nr:hypothetical protein [Jiangellales bacterium]
MAGRSTVNSYDRGGRGESGPCSSPYDVAREVEDLLAVIGAAGGSPVIVDDTHAPNDPRLPERLQAYVDEGRRGEAVKTFLRTVGAPGLMIALMPLMPVWRKLTGVAHTLPYDLSIVIEHEQGRPLPAGY